MLKCLKKEERLSIDEKFFFDYDHEKVNKMLMNTEEELGREEGQKEKAIEIAKKLLIENIKIEKTAEIISLSIEEVIKLKKEN